MQQTKVFLLVLLCGALFACANIPKPTPDTQTYESPITSTEEKTQPESKNTSKQPPTSFKISGAIAVNNKGKGWNASLNWRQQGPSYYNIRLSGPLGGKTVIISKKSGIVTYQEGSKIIKANSDNELLEKKANIHLPVHNLYYWVRGMPAPGRINFSKKSSSGAMEVIKQNGFTVIYSQYMTTNSGIMLPRKIRVTGNNVTIKLVIRSWN